MSTDSPARKGGVIRPSARRGIHSYKDNQLGRIDNMGRYGLNRSNNQNDRDNSLSHKDEGIDVVDNIMSKHRQTSPLSIKKKNIHRTNSYSPDEENVDDDTNVLSKSLPATLPSHLCYSDFDSELEEPNFSANSLTKSRAEDESHHSLMQNWSNTSSEPFQASPYQRKLSISSRDTSQPQSRNTTIYILLTLIIAIIAVYMKIPNLIKHDHQDKSTQTVNHNEIIFENNMNNLQEKYNIDGNSILKLKTGISTIFSRMDTGSFIFVYNSKTINFNSVRFEKFTDEVAYATARYLRNDISSVHHTVVESSNLDMQQHGELITRYRDDVARSGVMLVKEIDAVPSDLAMAFHYYCDEYEPLVKRSAIFFTLNVATCSNTSDQKSTHDFIEKCLARKWKTVPPENMRPLLTRVVDVIIDVTSVF